MPFWAGGGLAGAGLAGAAPLLPDGLAIVPELSAGAAGALLCEEAGGEAAGAVLAD
ncbi:MAG: hypothetical protein ACRETZ_01330 [Steroidobacteraceae bacterium]